MDAMLSEHYVTRFDVWSQTGPMKNGRIGVVTAQANSTRNREQEIKGSLLRLGAQLCGHNTFLVQEVPII